MGFSKKPIQGLWLGGLVLWWLIGLQVLLKVAKRSIAGIFWANTPCCFAVKQRLALGWGGSRQQWENQVQRWHEHPSTSTGHVFETHSAVGQNLRYFFWNGYPTCNQRPLGCSLVKTDDAWSQGHLKATMQTDDFYKNASNIKEWEAGEESRGRRDTSYLRVLSGLPSVFSPKQFTVGFTVFFVLCFGTWFLNISFRSSSCTSPACRWMRTMCARFGPAGWPVRISCPQRKLLGRFFEVFVCVCVF